MGKLPNNAVSGELDVQLIEQQYLELLHEKQSLRLRCNELKDAYFDEGLSDKTCYTEFEQISRRLMQINKDIVLKAEIISQQTSQGNESHA